MKKWFDNKTIAVALVSGVLFIGVIAGYVYGYSQYANSDHQSEVSDAWSIILLCTASVLAFLFALGVPYMYAKKEGMARFLKIVMIEAVLVAVALVVSGFFFFPPTSDCNNSPNSDFCGGGGIYQGSAVSN